MSPLQIEFEKKLIELGFSYSIHHDDLYTITSQHEGRNHIKVQLISSSLSIRQRDGNTNCNDIVAIGLFKFKFSFTGQESDLFIFALQNTYKNQAEFLIIPTNELMSRLVRKNPISVHRQIVEMVFWVMGDGFVYDTTHLSPEAEWYFMSKGVNGRMADGTEIDYSKYLNNWRGITAR